MPSIRALQPRSAHSLNRVRTRRRYQRVSSRLTAAHDFRHIVWGNLSGSLGKPHRINELPLTSSPTRGANKFLIRRWFSDIRRKSGIESTFRECPAGPTPNHGAPSQHKAERFLRSCLSWSPSIQISVGALVRAPLVRRPFPLPPARQIRHRQHGHAEDSPILPLTANLPTRPIDPTRSNHPPTSDQ